jgi:REP element-mobilizing transposase RayT
LRSKAIKTNYMNRGLRANRLHRKGQNNHPKELISNEFMQHKLDNIHNNPVEAGIVEKPEDYLYSSPI